jgi:Tfp pilus assembly protein PilF
VIELLEGLGMGNVEQAADGAAAFHVLKRRPVDCVISAWEMPQMNGLTLLKVISVDEDLYQIPFIIMTPNINRGTVMEAGRYGVTSILVEPFSGAILREKIDGIFNRDKDEKSEVVEDFFKSAKRLIEEGKYDEALVVYKRMLEVYEDAEVYYNIGYIKTAQEKYDEALIAFRKAVMINNLHARAFKKMGEVHVKRGEPEMAEEYFKKAGDIFLQKDMDKEAEEAYKEVLKLNPDTTNVYNSLGILYRKQHNYDEAVKQYYMAIKVNPDDENIFYNLGRALLEAKRIEEAKDAFSKAIEINPDFTEAKRMLQAINVGFG